MRGTRKTDLQLLTRVLSVYHPDWAQSLQADRLPPADKLVEMTGYLGRVCRALSLFVPASNPSYGVTERGGDAVVAYFTRPGRPETPTSYLMIDVSGFTKLLTFLTDRFGKQEAGDIMNMSILNRYCLNRMGELIHHYGELGAAAGTHPAQDALKAAFSFRSILGKITHEVRSELAAKLAGKPHQDEIRSFIRTLEIRASAGVVAGRRHGRSEFYGKSLRARITWGLSARHLAGSEKVGGSDDPVDPSFREVKGVGFDSDTAEVFQSLVREGWLKKTDFRSAPFHEFSKVVLSPRGEERLSESTLDILAARENPAGVPGEPPDGGEDRLGRLRRIDGEMAASLPFLQGGDLVEQVVKGMGPDGELEMLFGESSSRVHETGILFANFSITAAAVLDELSEVVHEAMARYGLVYKYNIFPLGDFNLMAAMGLELAGAPETDRFYAEVLWQCWQDLLSAVDRSFGRRVRMRAGMSVGQCLQGPVGDNLLHNEITIIGPDCNLAARLVARAMVRKERHGTLFAAADNYLRVSHLVRPAEPFEQAELKGFHDPVPLYSLRSRTGHESPAQLAERLRRLPLVTGAGEVIHDWSRISLDSQLGACKTDIESFQRKPNAPNRLIAFCGPGGEGKTRRIAEIVHWCSRRNWQVFFSECLSWYQGTRSRTEEGDGRSSKLAVPFHPFVKILRDQLFEVRPGDSPERAMERIAATFKRLGHGSAAGENAPVVASFLGIEDPRAGAVPEAMTPEERRNVFFETVALLFEAMITSSGGRLLVVIDDLQWADPGSVRLLSFLLGRVRGGLLVCTSVRNKEQIAGLIEGEEPDKGGRLVVESQKLEGPGVDMLTRVALGLKPDHQLPKALELRLAELESNPLFILEFCRILTDREVIFVRDGEIQRFDEKVFAGVTVPNRIQSVVEEMVNRLPRRDYDLIRGCSVLGTVLRCRDAAELASLAGRGRSAGPGEVQQMLHGLAGRQVLVIEQDQGQDSVYRFSRALIAQALYQGLTPSLRKRLHGFAAHIWEAAGAERQLEKCLNCAMHYELAEIPDRAAGYYLESGRMEGALFENERAVELLDKVEEFCRSHRIEGDINLLLGVHEFRGGTALALGRYETALEDSKKLGTLAGRLGKQDKVVLSRLAAGRIYLTRGRAGDFKLALARYRVAEEAAGGELIQTLEARNGQTRVLLEMGNLEEAIERATSSLSRLGRRRRRRDVREVILEARLLRTHGSSLMRLSRYEEAIAVFDTALALVEKSQDSACQPVQAQILNSKALALGSSFKLQEALDLYYKARSLARKVGDINLQLLILNNMSVALNDLGKNTQALDLLVSNYDTIRRLAPESRALAGFEFNIGECYHFMEDFPRAERHYRRALEITQKIQSRQFGVNVMYNLGEVLRDQGKEEEAFEVLDAAADVARKFGYRQQLLDMENILGEMDLAAGRVAQATRRHEDALAVARELDDTFAIGWSLRNLAEDYLAKGGADKTAKAGTLLAESLDFCRQAGQPENTLVTLACLLKNRDRLVLDAARCGSLLEELETLAKKINSQKYLELYARYRSELKNGGSRR